MAAFVISKQEPATLFTNRQMQRHPEMFGITLYAPDAADTDSANTDIAGGGVSAAVLEKPAGLATESTTDDSAGNEAGDVSTETEHEEDGGDKAKTPLLDEDTEAIFAARLEEDRKNREREQADTRAREAEEAAEQAHREELRSHYSRHEATLKEKIDGIGVVIEGETYRLTPETRGELLGVLEQYEKDAANSIGLRLRETLTHQVLANLPEAERAAAQKRLDAADPKDFARTIGEVYAPRASTLSDLDLDGVLALSPKAKRAYAETIKAAKDEAKKGERMRIYTLHGITQDEPDTSGAAAVSSYASEAALNRAFNARTISREVYAREYKKLTGREP